MAKDLSIKYSAFPSDFAPLEEKKQDKYGLEYVRAMYATYIINYPPNNPQFQRYINNRKFAEGTYDTSIYKHQMGLAGDTSYLNLDMTSINRIPTIIDNMVGKMTNKPWRFQCDPIDTVSRSKYDKKRAELKADMFLKQKSNELEQVTGMPLIPKGKFVPEDDEEAELHMQMNFKLDEATAMELALEWVFDNCRFSEDSLPALYRDYFTDKKTAIFRYYDSNKNIRAERWDHLKLIHPYSPYEDFRDIPYQGLLKSYTIGTIAKMNPNFTDEDLYNIARDNAGLNNNSPWLADWGVLYSDYYNVYGANAYRQFQNFYVNVINFYFLSPVTTTKVIKVSEKKRTRLELKKEGYKNDKGFETLNKRKLVRFEGYWIPNTDYVWDYKMSENMDRDVVAGAYSPETELPCKIIQPNKIGLDNKSMVERMMPFEKQLCLAWYKLQQFLIEAMPPGIAIDQNALLEVIDGAGEGKPLPTDWTKLYKQTGNIIFTSRDAEGNIINKPFEQLAGGISQAFQQFLAVMDYCINKMNEVVGYNTAVDASSPKADALVGTQQMAAQSTYDALRPAYLSIKGIIEDSGKRVALMIQDSLRHGNEDFKSALTDAIGEKNVEVLTMGRDMPMSSAAITVEIEPDDQEMVEINQLLQLELQNQTITVSDVLRVRQQMKTNTKLAGQLLAYLIKKNAKEKQKQALELQQQNGQVQIQSAQAASQAQAELDAILTENKIKLIQMQSQADMAKEQFKLQGEKEVQAMKNEGAAVVAAINSDRAERVQQEINRGKEAVEHIKHESGMRHIAFENAVAPKEKSDKK